MQSHCYALELKSITSCARHISMISDCDWAQQQQWKSSKLKWENITKRQNVALIVEMGQKEWASSSGVMKMRPWWNTERHIIRQKTKHSYSVVDVQNDGQLRGPESVSVCAFRTADSSCQAEHDVTQAVRQQRLLSAGSAIKRSPQCHITSTTFIFSIY